MAKNDQIYEAIKMDIIHNVYKAQQRIAEEELARKYSVSRTPIREALRRLQQEGFVNCVKNVGTFIRQISVREVGDFFDARGVLEGLAARLAAQNATPEMVQQLYEDSERILKAHMDRTLEEANSLDVLFHREIHLIAGNEFVLNFLDSKQDRLFWFLNISNLNRMDYLSSIPMNKMKHNHPALIDAIAGGDSVRAEQAARAHVEEAKKYFIDYCYNKFMN